MNNTVDIAHEICGFWTLQAFKIGADGREHGRRTVAEFPNLILNSGLDAIGRGDAYLRFCRVGTGSATPIETQTNLGSQVAFTESRAPDGQVSSNLGVSPYYTSLKNVFRFGEGVASGNLTEIGVGWDTAGSTLFSRALILDGGGSPTVLPVQPDEYLDAVYDLRIYPPLGDIAGSINITGSGTHDYTMRGCDINATDGFAWANNTYAGPRGGGRTDPSGNAAKAYSGAIGSNIQAPAGDVYPTNSYTNSSYSSGAYYRDYAVSFELGSGNIPTGIRSVRFLTGFGCHQIEFNPVINKTSAQKLTFNFRHTWARRA